VLQTSGELDLAQEALRAERRGYLRVQHLEGDPPVMLEVLGEVDRGHAPAAKLALEHVAVGQSGLEAGSDFGQVDGPTRSLPQGSTAISLGLESPML
jgi:hypothetical protein